VALGALTVAAALGAEVRAAAEALEVAQVVVAAQHHVAAAAAVAPVGPALWHVRLAPEREAAVAARTGADLDACAVVQHATYHRRRRAIGNVAACPACAGEAGLIGEGERRG
jgi:hypothetical protein